jgi:DNA uptake protein ComE-like DNA-binding protein
MPIIYAPDGTPYDVPQGEVPSFLRQGFRATKPAANEQPPTSQVVPPPQMDTTKTGGIGSSKEINDAENPRQATDIVPSLKEVDGSWANTYAGQPIKINSATLKELTTLPGVGTAIARKVVENRPYKSAEDLIAKVEIPTGDWLTIANKLSFEDAPE